MFDVPAELKNKSHLDEDRLQCHVAGGSCVSQCLCIFRYLTNRLHFSVRVYCNRSQMMSQRVKNKTVRQVEWRDCCSLYAVTYSGTYIQYTHTEKYNLFVLYNKNLKDFGGMKKEKQVC